MAVEVQSPQDLEFERRSAEAEAENAKRTGVGTRKRVGRTRGKGSMVIDWEAFDDAFPESLPKTQAQFMEVTGIDTEDPLVKCLIAGYNDIQYTAASDPIAEFVDSSWPPDAQTQFRLVVRNYSRGANVPLENAVNLIKPGFVAQFSKK